ncbi:MAG: methyltransferase domain-containing protein [Bacteroidetes bacterium]|nr:MAG: methyltransferase domain-containing protein [Bacteroidota bacterium]
MAPPPFQFKRFRIEQDAAVHAVGIDGVLLGVWADVTNAGSVLDIGTGTGVAALIVAQRTDNQPAPPILAIDLHAAAVACANRNFRASPWAGRMQVQQAAVQTFAAAATRTFDLVVCNPPYFEGSKPSPDPNRRISRSGQTLRLPELVTAARTLLSGQGKICLIMPPTEARKLYQLAAGQGLYCSRILEVHGRPEKPVERLLVQLERTPYPFSREVISIYDTGNGYSEAFWNLTRDFYLDGQG